MGVLSETTEKLLNFFLSLKEDDWIQWIAQKNDWQDDCDKFNNCFFIVKNMPNYPQHINCQCRLEKINKPIPNVTAKAICDIRKFTEYIFSENYDDGKRELFESWGYKLYDSEYLRNTYIEQALQNYCNGDYAFVGTNSYSAKIKIYINLLNNKGVNQKISSIWELKSNGTLKLITPYSGHVYKE